MSVLQSELRVWQNKLQIASKDKFAAEYASTAAGKIATLGRLSTEQLQEHIHNIISVNAELETKLAASRKELAVTQDAVTELQTLLNASNQETSRLKAAVRCKTLLNLPSPVIFH